MLELWIKIFHIFDVAIVINHGHKWKVMTLANSIIIMIMSWCYLYSTLNEMNLADFSITNQHIKAWQRKFKNI